MSDRDFLIAYQRNKSPAIFCQIVSAHINLVYSVARRVTRNDHLAEDVTQEVFLTLARKAAALKPDIPLAGWLFTTTRLLSLQSLRAASRRARYETEAAMSQPSGSDPDPLWPLIAQDIDQAIADLPPTDRDAILLRYFNHQSTLEVAATLAISEEAARKRLQRALDALQKLLTSRGFATSSSVTLAAALTTHAVHVAPPALSTSITSALTTKAAMLATKGTLMVAAKLKAVIAITAALALIAIPTTIYLFTRTTPAATPIAESAPATFIPAVPDDYAAAYALAPNQYIAIVNNINPAARAAIFHKQNPESNITNPGSLVISWQGDKISNWGAGGGDGYPLGSIVSHLLDTYSPKIVSSLLLPSPKGDIVFREGGTPEQYLADLQSILTTYFHRPIVCTIQNKTMDVVVLSGNYKLIPLPTAPRTRSTSPTLSIYLNAVDTDGRSGGGGIAHDQRQFAGNLSEQVDYPVVCEITNFPQRVLYTYSSDLSENRPFTETDKTHFLQHVTEQTSLTVTHETRPVRCLIINPVDPKISAAAWQGYPKTSPFQAVRWNNDSPEVQIDNNWYQLLGVSDVPIEKIIAFAKQSDPKDWQRRFEEDFIALIALMGRDMSDWKYIEVKIKVLDSDKIETRALIATKDNRDAIHKALTARETPATNPQ